MDGSPNNLRIMWQFFEKDFLATDAFKNPRDFHRFDEKYFDHFNIRVSEVIRAGPTIPARNWVSKAPLSCFVNKT